LLWLGLELRLLVEVTLPDCVLEALAAGLPVGGAEGVTERVAVVESDAVDVALLEELGRGEPVEEPVAEEEPPAPPPARPALALALGERLTLTLPVAVDVTLPLPLTRPLPVGLGVAGTLRVDEVEPLCVVEPEGDFDALAEEVTEAVPVPVLLCVAVPVPVALSAACVREPTALPLARDVALADAVPVPDPVLVLLTLGEALTVPQSLGVREPAGDSESAPLTLGERVEVPLGDAAGEALGEREAEGHALGVEVAQGEAEPESEARALREKRALPLAPPPGLALTCEALAQLVGEGEAAGVRDCDAEEVVLGHGVGDGEGRADAVSEPVTDCDRLAVEDTQARCEGVEVPDSLALPRGEAEARGEEESEGEADTLSEGLTVGESQCEGE